MRSQFFTHALGSIFFVTLLAWRLRACIDMTVRELPLDMVFFQHLANPPEITAITVKQKHVKIVTMTTWVSLGDQ